MTALYVRVHNAWFAVRDDESGQTLIEYALVISLVGIASITALLFLQGKISDLFHRAGESLDQVPNQTTTTVP